MEKQIFYSVIVVCLNAGQRLEDTIQSIVSQKYENYEIIIKDGKSSDGSIDRLKNNYSDIIDLNGSDENKSKKIKLYSEADESIYDAMNQAIMYAKGDYFIFMNAGDNFYDENVLENITRGILKDKKAQNKLPDIVYGNMYHKALETVINSAPQINDFTCYRNVPCHQTCFYSREMFGERGYNVKYNVRADYEHFLWCYYKKEAFIKYVPVIVASYEGGGYSETVESKKQSATQHREIVVEYMGRFKADKYRIIMLLSLAPLRSAMANSDVFSGIYNKIKSVIYKLKKS